MLGLLLDKPDAPSSSFIDPPTMGQIKTPRHTSAGMSQVVMGVKIRCIFFDNRIAF